MAPLEEIIVEDFPPMPRFRRRKFAALLQGADLIEGQRVPLDGRRSMAIARAGVFLQGGNPGQIHPRALNPLTQCRHPFDFGKQVRSDGELRDIGHG